MYGGRGVILKYFGCVGIKRDGAMSISNSFDSMKVSMSVNSFVGDKANESSREWAPRYSS